MPARRGRLRGGDASDLADSPAAISPTPSAEDASAVAGQAAPAVLTPPVLVDPGRLDYPQAAYRMEVERDGPTVRTRAEAVRGRVVLKVLVRADGTVGAVEVARSSGEPALDEAAAAAAWRWTFHPATRDGRPIDSWALIPVRFVLE